MQISGVCGLRTGRAFEGKSAVSQGKLLAPLCSAVERLSLEGAARGTSALLGSKDITSNADAAIASFSKAVVGLLQTGNCTPGLPWISLNT